MVWSYRYNANETTLTTCIDKYEATILQPFFQAPLEHSHSDSTGLLLEKKEIVSMRMALFYHSVKQRTLYLKGGWFSCILFSEAIQIYKHSKLLCSIVLQDTLNFLLDFFYFS